MYFKQILNERCGCASYLIASRQTGEAAVVDPASETAQYDEVLHGCGFTLKYVIDTHIHADHVSGARTLATAHRAALCLHAAARVTYSFTPLTDGQELLLGQLRLRVLHCPGHRPELISLLIINPLRSPEPSMVLTGDSLLAGDVGRPDFDGGDPQAQYETVTRLLRLPDWVAVFPGHFEGPCGKGMCGRPSTTIGFERLFNPLARMERAPCVAELTDGIPARPLTMTAIEATNRGTGDLAWAMLTTTLEVPSVTIDDVARRSPDTVLLDVREPEEYARGHVPGAVSLPQADLATMLDTVPRDRPVQVICQSGSRSLRSAQFLRQIGYNNVANMTGGMAAWYASGKRIETADMPASASGIDEGKEAYAGSARAIGPAAD